MLLTESMRRRFIPLLAATTALLVPLTAFASGGGGVSSVPLWSLLPFVLMLGAIAVLPLTAEHWWEDNSNKFKIGALLGIPVGAFFLYADWHRLANVGLEYLSFMTLLASLFIISGGIVLRGDLRATPTVNSGFLLLGAVLASFMGTTGAAMLLIRPVLKTNHERRYKVHTVIFFIFLVANIGGCLTPLGDPPLFMGYLRGVSFLWTFNLWVEWAVVSVILLVIHHLWDRWLWAKETDEVKAWDASTVEPLQITGLINLPLLAGVVALVAFAQSMPALIDTGHAQLGFREIGMVVLAFLSMRVTPKALREENNFNFHPINEVAALFFGIFLTMIPALIYLEANGAGLGVTEPWQYFWATGTLSAFLDNTPTYIVFFEMARASDFGEVALVANAVPHNVLVGISLGAVFMGAMTYIGNGPNFMVKAIADAEGVRMPSFFGYLLYAVVVLVPVFVLVTFVFLI